MLEKIKKDKFYSEYYQKTKDLKMLEKAGFFNDNIDNLEYNIDFLCTPINKLKLKKNEINYVILTTGSYSPVHDGHISILELSRNKLTELGYHVAGAYISPSHDSYVSVKNNGISKKHILERISLINEKIYKSDFIMLDPWEGCFTPKAINFTDVILRLEEYLTHYTKHNIKVIYAYGSDNYEFGLIFKDRFSICIERNQRCLQQVDNNVIYIFKNQNLRIYHLLKLENNII